MPTYVSGMTSNVPFFHRVSSKRFMLRLFSSSSTEKKLERDHEFKSENYLVLVSTYALSLSLAVEFTFGACQDDLVSGFWLGSELLSPGGRHIWLLILSSPGFLWPTTTTTTPCEPSNLRKKWPTDKDGSRFMGGVSTSRHFFFLSWLLLRVNSINAEGNLKQTLNFNLLVFPRFQAGVWFPLDITLFIKIQYVSLVWFLWVTFRGNGGCGWKNLRSLATFISPWLRSRSRFDFFLLFSSKYGYNSALKLNFSHVDLASCIHIDSDSEAKHSNRFKVPYVTIEIFEVWISRS